MDPLLTPQDVVKRLGKSVDFWERAARARTVPFVRLGRSIRFTEEDVAEIVRRARVEPTDVLRDQTDRSRTAARNRRTA